MSRPEPARGELLDARTDISSLGMVLFEMATGRRAPSQDYVADGRTDELITDLGSIGSLRVSLGLQNRVADAIAAQVRATLTPSNYLH